MGARVLDAVLGQLPVALLLAIADAKLEVRIVGVAPAALGADARAPRRRREGWRDLPPGTAGAPQAGAERPAAEEQERARGDEDRRTGGETAADQVPDHQAGTENAEVFDLHRKHQEQDLVIRELRGEGEEQRFPDVPAR